VTRATRHARRGAALLAAALLGGGWVVAAAPSAYAENAAVSATGSNTFEPSRVAVNVGDTVTWTTTGGVQHTVTSSSANWRKDSSIALVGQSTTFAFSRGGTYTYYCKTHGSPTTGMRGSVVVAAPTQPAPSPTRTTARPTPRPSASPTAKPTPSRTAAPTRSPSARPTSPSPAPSRSAAVIALPTFSPAPASTSAAPDPTVAEDPTPDATVDLGSGGLGPRPESGRGRGLPAFLALVALGGVVSAQVRALLAMPTDDRR